LTLRTSTVCLLVCAYASLGCSHTPKQPPGVPPSPKTITREEPGGDAYDPQQAALERLVLQQWGWRNDKKNVFHFPLTDSKNWRRVRYWGVPTFVGFRYGDKHRAIAAMWLQRQKDEEPATPMGCMTRFEKWGLPIADAFSTKVENVVESNQTWKTPEDVVVRTLEADVRTLLAHRHYFGVVGATVPWPGICAVYGFAFEADDSGDLAKKARDRYAIEGYRQLVRMSETPPDGIE
jgi:hypothetical protein